MTPVFLLSFVDAEVQDGIPTRAHTNTIHVGNSEERVRITMLSIVSLMQAVAGSDELSTLGMALTGIIHAYRRNRQMPALTQTAVASIVRHVLVNVVEHGLNAERVVAELLREVERPNPFMLRSVVRDLR